MEELANKTRSCASNSHTLDTLQEVQEDLAPDLVAAVEIMDVATIKDFIEKDWPVNLPVTNTGIALYSLLMGVDVNLIEANDNTRKDYIALLKLIKKKKPDIQAVDALGRTCLHHAASVGNVLGAQFTVQLTEYIHEKKIGGKAPKGTLNPEFQALLIGRTIGGVTPLMRAAEALNVPVCTYLLQLGASPFEVDNRGRTARRYA